MDEEREVGGHTLPSGTPVNCGGCLGNELIE